MACPSVNAVMPALALPTSAPPVKRGSGRLSRAGMGSMRALSSLYSSDNNIRTETPEQLSLRYRVIQTLASGMSTVEVVRRQDDARLLVLKVSWPCGVAVTARSGLTAAYCSLLAGLQAVGVGIARARSAAIASPRFHRPGARLLPPRV
jgi:hypothetical protein